MTNTKNTKKWLVLSVATTALLLIPRRSSRKANIKTADSDATVSKSSGVEIDPMNEPSKQNLVIKK